MTPIARHIPLALLPAALVFAQASFLSQAAAPSQDDGARAVVPAKEALQRIIDPPSAASTDGPDVAEVKAAIQQMLGRNPVDVSKIGIFGPQGAAALMSIIDDVGLVTVAEDFPANPLPILFDHFPVECVGILSGLEANEPELFDMYVRSGYGPGRLILSGAVDSGRRDELLALVDRTLVRPSLAPELRVKLAVDALVADAVTPAARALITENLESVGERYRKRLGSKLLPYFSERFGEDLANLPGSLASYLLNYRGDEPTLIRLSTSPEPFVRRLVASMLENQIDDSVIRVEAVKDIVIPMLGDDDPEVEKQAQETLATLLNRNQEALLDLEDLERIARALPGGLPTRTDLAQYVVRQIEMRLSTLSEGEKAQAKSVLLQLLRSGDHKVVGALNSTSWRFLSGAAVAVLLEVELAEGSCPPNWRAAAERHFDARVGGDRGETVLATFMALADHPDFAARGAGASIRNIGPALIPEALRWLGETDERFDKLAMKAATNWEGAAGALRASAFDATRPWRERAIALCALFLGQETTARDAELASAVLREALADPARRAEFKRIHSRGLRENESWSSPHWILVIDALYADDNLPSSTLAWLNVSRPAVTAADVAVMARIVDAADRRRAQDSSRPTFSRIAVACLATSLDPSLDVDVLEGHGDLIMAWSEDAELARQCVSYAIVRRPEIGERLANVLSRQLENEDSPYTQKLLVGELLRVPSDKAIPALLAVTQRVGTTTLLKYVDERTSELLRIREIQQRWGSGGATTRTTESAKAAVIGMLDDEREIVRVEAIRGLATLGAVETLPRLIEILATGSEKEVAAARVALDQLHRRAALALDDAEDE